MIRHLVLLLAFFCSILRAEFTLVHPDEVDDIPARFKSKSRVVAVGDIHGDFEGLAAILLDRRVMNEEGHWIAGDADVVTIGDYVSGEPHSRFVLDLLMRLEGEAKSAGGRLHALIGNKEILAVRKNYNDMSEGEWEFFDEDPFRHDEPHGKWIRGLNSMIEIDGNYFVHAGVDPDWFKSKKLERLNTTVRDWISHFQKVGDKPEKETSWVVKSPYGPMWDRGLKPRERSQGAFKTKKPLEGVSRKDLIELLDAEKVLHLIAGHAPIGKILVEHPHYGDRVTLIDSRISDSKEGRLGSIEIRDGKITAHYSRRNARSRGLLNRVLKEFEDARCRKTLPKLSAVSKN